MSMSISTSVNLKECVNLILHMKYRERQCVPPCMLLVVSTIASLAVVVEQVVKDKIWGRGRLNIRVPVLVHNNLTTTTCIRTANLTKALQNPDLQALIYASHFKAVLW
jgi:hypothetical protein